MRRREVIAGLATAVWPMAAGAQARLPVIGFLHSASLDRYTTRVRAFYDGLGDAGYVEGRNVAVKYRWAEGDIDRLPNLASELVREDVAVIVAGGIPATLAANAATKTVPILFQLGADPVELGLVSSLNRPGGNLSGVVNLNVELGPKRLELLHQVVPEVTVVALLVNPTNPNFEPLVKAVEAAGRSLGLQIVVLYARAPSDFDAAFASLRPLGAGALVIGTDGIFISRSEELAELSVHHGIPAIFQYREFAAAGGLMSYGGNFSDAYRQIGVYAGRILKGEKPADLPVQQTTTVELIINLRTAKALGLSIPLPLLGRASEVIE